MSDTQETDARTYGFTDEDGIHCEAVHADFARKLERERDEAQKTAERYRLKTLEQDAKIAKLQAGLDDIEQYGTEEINAAVDLRQKLAAALVERDEALTQIKHNHKAAEMLEKMVYAAREQRDQWREFAVRLARCVRAENKLRPLLFSADFEAALADFDRLMEGSK